MALGDTFDLGRIIQTAEVIKGLRRQEGEDALRNKYLETQTAGAQQQQKFAASQEQREATKFSQEQQIQNTRMLNVAAKAVAADPTQAGRWLPELQKAGVVAPNLDISQITPEQLQQLAQQIAGQTDVELTAYLRQNPQFAIMDQEHTNRLGEIEAQGKNQQGLAASQNKYELGQIAARGAQDLKTAEITAGGKAFKNTQALRKEYEDQDAVKNYRTVLPIINSAKNAPDNGYGDLDLIYATGKILDPGSVVREGELNLTIASGSPLQRLLGATRFSIEKGGRLTPQQRQQLVGMLKGRVGALADAYAQERERYGRYAHESGFEPSQVVGNDPAAAFEQAPQPAAGVQFIYVPGKGLQQAQ